MLFTCNCYIKTRCQLSQTRADHSRRSKREFRTLFASRNAALRSRLREKVAYRDLRFCNKECVMEAVRQFISIAFPSVAARLPSVLPSVPNVPSVAPSDAATADANALNPQLLSAMLDSVDYGLCVLSAHGHVVRHLNAQAELVLQRHATLLALRRYGTQRALIALHSPDHALLAHAFAAAARGKTQMLRFGATGATGTAGAAGRTGAPPEQLGIAVSPLNLTDPDSGEPLLLLSFEKPVHRADQTLRHFGDAHQLTRAELQVLRGLTEGDCPKRIAQRNEVAESTVRSQIRSIRQKTQCEGIRELVLSVARLPAML